MRILVAAGDRFDGDAVAADLASDRREILGRGHDIELALSERRGRRDDKRRCD
jgi:hypothetical protein